MVTKIDLDTLAIFGGPPAFREPLHVGRPNIGNKMHFLQRVNDLLDRKWLTNDGPYVQEFEKKIATLVGVKHCISVCNATLGLEIAIRATGLNSEVLVPSFTFIATSHALWWQGITPVFCDIDPYTHNLSCDQVEKMITPRTSGILGVHLWGRPCDIDVLSKIAYRHNLKLLFDAAHAFGCSYKGRMIGNFGDAEVFSFHATKFINTFEGGAIVTNNDELAEKARLMRNFGFAGYDNVVSIGTNGKMSEVSAAMGITSLESLPEFISTNQRNYEYYRQKLIDISGVSLLNFNKDERNNYQYVVLEIDNAVSQVSRDQLQKILWAENILARRYFSPGTHRMEPYRSDFPDVRALLPETERLSERVITLPTGTSVGPDEIDIICQIIRLVVANGDKVQKRLKIANLSY